MASHSVSGGGRNLESAAAEKAKYDEERIRAAEVFQNVNEKDFVGNEKPAVVILQFNAGAEVQLNEVETLTNFVRTNLVKTKLFEIVDTSVLLKDCPRQTKDCVKMLPPGIRRNKIITGTLTKLGKTYYINGNVLDAKKDTIDFGNCLFCKHFPFNHISGFSINATSGSLTALSGSPYAGTSGNMRTAIHPSGKYL